MSNKEIISSLKSLVYSVKEFSIKNDSIYAELNKMYYSRFWDRKDIIDDISIFLGWYKYNIEKILAGDKFTEN